MKREISVAEKLVSALEDMGSIMTKKMAKMHTFGISSLS
jgi:hypothetical protein